jgi:hypothetical protein
MTPTTTTYQENNNDDYNDDKIKNVTWSVVVLVTDLNQLVLCFLLFE